MVIKFDLSKKEMQVMILGLGMVMRGYDDKFNEVAEICHRLEIKREDIENVLRKMGVKGDINMSDMMT